MSEVLTEYGSGFTERYVKSVGAREDIEPETRWADDGVDRVKVWMNEIKDDTLKKKKMK